MENVPLVCFVLPLLSMFVAVLNWGAWYGLIRLAVLALDNHPLSRRDDGYVMKAATVFSTITYAGCVVAFVNLI